jgi:hypothetical protein
MFEIITIIYDRSTNSPDVTDIKKNTETVNFPYETSSPLSTCERALGASYGS